MKIFAHTVTGLTLATAMTLSAQNKAQGSEPIAWGALSGNSSCVIFAEGHKTSGRFYGVAVTTKTTGKLTLVEAQNYTFSEKELLETQENLDNLMLMAQKDHVKFVKIPEKYSPELLEKARASRKADAR
ncbi:MAG: hypothetical protein ACRYFU_14505 [Janthinobacterium lividum]